MTLSDKLRGVKEPTGPSYALRPELLLHNNIPKPMHGVAPRVVLGQKWWDRERRECYERAEEWSTITEEEDQEFDIQLREAQEQDDYDWWPPNQYVALWDWRSLKRESGIYQILNVVTRKRYIGSSKSIGIRWKDHRNFLRNGRHYNKHLQHSWDKYGESRFVFSVLEFCPIRELVTAEQRWIDRMRVYGESGYNAAPHAGSCRGCKRTFTKEHRANLSKSSVKIRGPLSEEHKKKLSIAFQGREFSEQHRANLSAAQIGRKLTDADILKMRLTKRAKSGLSEQQRKRMRELYEVRKKYNSSKRKYTVAQLAKTFRVSYSIAYANVKGKPL